MRVSPDLHARVLRRDGMCFLYRMNNDHQCRDAWGEPHRPYELRRLTLDHVNLVAGGIRGKRAPDDEQHMVAMCAAGNNSALPASDPFKNGPDREVRQAERKYLNALYSDCTGV